MNNHRIKAIANVTRLQIIEILDTAKELNVGELEKKFTSHNQPYLNTWQSCGRPSFCYRSNIDEMVGKNE